MDLYHFRLEIAPRPEERVRWSRSGKPYIPTATKKYRAELRELMKRVWPREPLESYFRLALGFGMDYIEVYLWESVNTPKIVGDIDNLTVPVLNAGNGIIWADDKFCEGLYAEKRG